MINILLTMLKIDITQKVNAFISFLMDMPFINRFISTKLYKKSDIKIYIGFIVAFLLLIGEVLKKAIFLYFIIYLPSYYLNSNHLASTFIQIFILLSFVVTFFSHSELFVPSQKKYIAIKIMNIDAKKYMLVDLLYKNLLASITLIPGLMVIFKDLKVNVIYAFLLAIFYFISKLFREVYYLIIFKKFKINILQRPIYIITVIVLGLCLTYILPYYNLVLSYSFISNPLIIFLNIIIAFVTIFFLLDYDKYKEISNNTLKRNNILFNMDEIKRDVNFAQVKIKSKDLNKQKNDMFSKKEGYIYLNSLFLARHKRIILKPIKIFVGITLFYFLIGIVLSTFSNYHQDINQVLREIVSYYFLILYFASIGERTCKAYFYNLDSSLLRYSYYREKKAILDNFKIRLKMLIKLNIIPAIILAFSFIFLFIINNADIGIGNYLLLGLSMIMLSVFFSVNSLFLYYIFQPYTKNYEIVSPIYSFLKIILYFIGYMFIYGNVLSIKFSLLLLLVIVIYIIIVLYLINHFAIKTFRLK